MRKKEREDNRRTSEILQTCYTENDGKVTFLKINRHPGSSL